MQHLPGFKHQEKIFEGKNSIVYRALRTHDDLPVIIKAPHTNDPRKVAKLRHEYEITRQLKLNCVIRVLDLQKIDNGWYLILEDTHGDSLQSILASRKFDLRGFLNIAVQLVQGLNELHSHDIIHKDIKPANIIVSSDNKQVKITDLSISQRLEPGHQSLPNPEHIEGTFQYMSPEQTGRMNRSIDYRSDYYSLGMLLYEVLLGFPPFQSSDSMELVHCHIAKEPVPPHTINPGIPKVISDIIMKLMSKNAEDRYQSGRVLHVDFENCLKQIEESGKIKEFEFARDDFADRFQLPQKLYGRKQALNSIARFFQELTHSKAHLALISGRQGAGKSALVEEFSKLVTERQGYFIVGDFNKAHQLIPYSAMVSAFSKLVRQLLAEPEDRQTYWRKKLLTALGKNGQMLIDVIPELELIIGEQDLVPALEAKEAQNRFNLVFEQFIQVFGQASHPLVIFLDNLQWADKGTLDLMCRLLPHSKTRYLMVIGAYRHNELDKQHPVRAMMKTMNDSQVESCHIHLRGLSQKSLVLLLQDTFHASKAEMASLAGIIHRKTGGIPFFIREFLQTLHTRNLFRFKYSSKDGCGRWVWDETQIDKLAITDNVAELLAFKLHRMPRQTKEILGLAACFGDACALSELSHLLNMPAGEVERHLEPVLHDDLLIITHETSDEEHLPDRLDKCYRFPHSHVQQAAYGLLKENRQQAWHLAIGRYWLENMPPVEQEEKLFEMTRQWNAGRTLLESKKERLELANLNLAAADKAKDTTAYSSAWKYLKIALDCMGKEAWGINHRFTLLLYEELGEVMYLNGDIEGAEKLLLNTLKKARTPLEKARLYHLLIVQYTMAANYQQALDAGYEALRLLGVEMPDTDFEVALQYEVDEVMAYMENKEVLSLCDASEMRDATQKAILRLLSNMVSPASFTNISLWAVIVSKMVNTSLRHGHLSESSFAYAGYATVLVAVLQDYHHAFEYGMLSMNLSDRFGDSAQQCKNANLLANYLNPWIQHVQWGHKLNNSGYKAGLESGEHQFCGYILVNKICNAFYQGERLPELMETLDHYLSFTERTQNRWATDALRGLSLTLANLSGETPKLLSFDFFPEKEKDYLKTCHDYKSHLALCLHSIFKLQVFYLYGHYEEAMQCSKEAEPLLSFVSGLIASSIHYFYTALTLAALCQEADNDEGKRCREHLQSYHWQLQSWAAYCPENFEHMSLLVAAEAARLDERDFEAVALYEKAIVSARDNSFVQHEAMANELAADFWFSRHKENYAWMHLAAAARLYRQWGAKRKIEELTRLYPELMEQAAQESTDRATSGSSITSLDMAGSHLDLSSVMKASQAISGEIRLDKLLTKLLKILLENAGAQKGCLILDQDGELLIQASASMDDNNPRILHSKPINDSHNLSPVIVGYVAKTKQAVVLRDAVKEGMYTKDPYIVKYRPKSVLCTPFTQQGRLVGVLYLENNLVTGAFTKSRLEMLNMLSSQAAVSIENALLYQDMESKVTQRTAELAHANSEINELNKRLQSDNVRMSAELDVTRQLQHMVLPKENELQEIEGLEISGFMEPAEEVGGDYYDVLQYGNHVRIGIGDVTGHGLASGVLMLMVQTAARTLSVAGIHDPKHTIDILNRTLHDNLRRMGSDKNLTLSVIDYHNKTFHVSGQHEEVLVVRQDGKVERMDTINLGFFVGMEEDISPFTQTLEIKLQAGEGIVLYTDGITEATNAANQQYDIPRLCNAISRNWSGNTAAQVHQAVALDVMQYIGEQVFMDDISLLVIKQR